MIRRPPRSTRVRSSAASDVYKRQFLDCSRASMGTRGDMRVAFKRARPTEMRLALAAEGRAVKRAFLCRRAWTTDALAARQPRDSRGRHAVHRCGNTEQLATAGAFIR